MLTKVPSRIEKFYANSAFFIAASAKLPRFSSLGRLLHCCLSCRALSLFFLIMDFFHTVLRVLSSFPLFSIVFASYPYPLSSHLQPSHRCRRMIGQLLVLAIALSYLLRHCQQLNSLLEQFDFTSDLQPTSRELCANSWTPLLEQFDFTSDLQPTSRELCASSSVSSFPTHHLPSSSETVLR